MKSILNKILLFSFLLALGITVYLYISVTHNTVGDVEINKRKGDNLDFELSGRALQYYSVNTTYQGSRKALREELYPYIKNLPLDKRFSGYITSRFIVNSKGQTDRFRVKATTADLEETALTAPVEETVIGSVKTLKKWIPGTFEDGIKADSYYQITLKVREGKVVDIF